MHQSGSHDYSWVREYLHVVFWCSVLSKKNFGRFLVKMSSAETSTCNGRPVHVRMVPYFMPSVSGFRDEGRRPSSLHGCILQSFLSRPPSLLLSSRGEEDGTTENGKTYWSVPYAWLRCLRLCFMLWFFLWFYILINIFTRRFRN